MEHRMINKAARGRMDLVEMIAREDRIYSRMLQENKELEGKYDAVLNSLSTEQMDIICDFVSQCEDMSLRILELACIYMRFPE